MTSRTFAGLVAAIVLVSVGCSRDLDPLGPAPFPSNAQIFTDFPGEGVSFQAFAGSKFDAVETDGSEAFRGATSMRVIVPAPDDPTGSYAGGAFTTNIPRDLTGYDALTFWARGSTAFTLNTVGLGNDNTDDAQFVAEAANIPISTSWTKFVIPIPDPSKLDQEDGLFFFAEGAEQPAGYRIWFDEVKYEKLGTLINPRPTIPNRSIGGEVGESLAIQGGQLTIDVGGLDRVMATAPAYFDFTSTNPGVARVDEDGSIQLVGSGTAEIRATLGGKTAEGTVTVEVSDPPMVAAPTPEFEADDVVSLFSDAYTNVPVSTWSADFDNADVFDVQIGGNNVKKYQNLVFAGIEFASPTVDASDMTHLYLDLWTQNASSFTIKLVDFGANGVFGGGDDSEHELLLNQSTTPSLAKGAWSSLEIPMSLFPGLTSRAHLAQIILTSANPTVYLDNVLFFRDVPTTPMEAAPTPTRPAGSVISLFSNAYQDVQVDTWSAAWDNADVADVQVAGDDTKLYTGLVFAGIEFTSQPVDATAMTHFHVDIWTPDATAPPAALRIQLVDFGADGAFGGGDDVNHELAFDANSTPPLTTGSWVSYDIPLADFTGLVTREHLAQIVLVGEPNTLYVDNVYFYGPPPTTPPGPAPTPTLPAANVISLFSNAYDDVQVDTWSAPWDNADVEDVQIAGNDTKKYTNFVFTGIEFTSQPVDATAMTHFHVDVWTPDPTAPPATLRIQLVDFGGDGAFGGGDDVNHELAFDASSDPPLATGSWVSYDIPLADFTGLVTREHLAQIVIVSDPDTVFIDNVYLHN